MRIRAIHTYEFGALGTQSFDFRDSWSDETATRILLSGANGCGKSTLLRGIAMLWSAFGYWLHNRKHLPEKSVERRFLSMGGGFAIVVENLPFAETKSLLLAFGEGHWSTNPALVKPDYIALGEGSGLGEYISTLLIMIHS